MFECVGKILGKAIYEGILMDVPFASFLLSMMCGRRYMTMYSSLDELSSLDPALDKSLHFVKVRTYECCVLLNKNTITNSIGVLGNIIDPLSYFCNFNK